MGQCMGQRCRARSESDGARVDAVAGWAGGGVMERLTFEGNFCDIAQCDVIPGGSYCESGSCILRMISRSLRRSSTRPNIEAMTMAECIEREAKWIEGYDGAMAMEIVAAAPAVDVAPVVHARWEPCFDKNCRCRWGFGKCSNCGQEYYAHAIDHYKYCPICGAKMDGAI